MPIGVRREAYRPQADSRATKKARCGRVARVISRGVKTCVNTAISDS